MEPGLELSPVVGLDRLDPERQPGQDLVDGARLACPARDRSSVLLITGGPDVYTMFVSSISAWNAASSASASVAS